MPWLRCLPVALLVGLIVIHCLPLAIQAVDAPLAGTVDWVYDGDTIKVEPYCKVRLIGIDAPESEAGPRDDYYLHLGLQRPRLRQTAKEAKTWLIRNLKGKRVRLSFDRVKHDKHGRLLAYVFLEDGLLINRLLLEKGLASVFRRYEFALKMEFLAVEAAARAKQVGLWQRQD